MKGVPDGDARLRWLVVPAIIGVVAMVLSCLGLLVIWIVGLIAHRAVAGS